MLDPLCDLLAMTLTLDFQGQNLIKAISQECNGRLTWKKGILLDRKSHPLCLNFDLTYVQGQILKKLCLEWEGRSVLSLEILVASDFDKVAEQQSISSSIIICNF